MGVEENPTKISHTVQEVICGVYYCKCFKVFFFHVEKTGGTTVRKLAREGAAAQGMEVYTQGMLKRVPDLDTPCNGTKGWYSSRCCSLERMLRDAWAAAQPPRSQRTSRSSSVNSLSTPASPVTSPPPSKSSVIKSGE